MYTVKCKFYFSRMVFSLQKKINATRRTTYSLTFLQLPRYHKEVNYNKISITIYCCVDKKGGCKSRNGIWAEVSAGKVWIFGLGKGAWAYNGGLGRSLHGNNANISCKAHILSNHNWNGGAAAVATRQVGSTAVRRGMNYMQKTIRVYIVVTTSSSP